MKPGPKEGKKEVFYDILAGQKKYYVGKVITYPDGRKIVKRLTGNFSSETEALRNR